MSKLYIDLSICRELGISLEKRSAIETDLLIQAVKKHSGLSEDIEVETLSTYVPENGKITSGELSKKLEEIRLDSRHGFLVLEPVNKTGDFKTGEHLNET